MEQIKDSTYKNRWFILFIVVMEPFMACLDASIVNVALPVMSKALNASMASITWVVTSYLIVISSTIMICGRLGDMKGKTNVFMFGLVLFTIGSLMCGISNSLLTLVISRIIQALGAAGTMATNQGIITHVFPPNERGRALGISGTFVALGTMLGPPLGGFIVSYFSYKYIFLINVPVGIITYIFALKILPKSTQNTNEKLHIKGALLFSSFVILLFGGLIRGQEIGFNIYIIVLILLSFIFLLLFINTEGRVSYPLVDLSLFKNKLFSISIACAFICFVSISCSNIILPFYLQNAVKLSPKSTGLLMMVSPFILSVIAPISGYLSDKIGSELLTFIGLILMSLSLFLMSFLNQYSSIVVIVIFLGIMSIGNGMFQSPNTSLIMSTVPKNKLGIAGSINALVRNLGIVFGVAFSTTLLYKGMSYKIGYRVTDYIQGKDNVFIFGMHYVYIAASLICMIGIYITAKRLYKKIKS